MMATGLSPREATNEVRRESSSASEQPGSTNAHEPDSSHTTLHRVWKQLNVKCSICIIKKSFKTHKFTLKFSMFANYYANIDGLCPLVW